MSAVIKPLVYLFDTEGESLQQLKRSLKEDYEVHVATSGRHAIALVHKQKRPAVVFIDIHFGGTFKGVELIAQMRRISRWALVCIYTSSDGSVDTHARALRAGGAISFCIKPVPEEIIRAYVDVVSVEQIKYLRNATRDMLTGLLNRMGFSEIGSWEIANAARHMTTTSLIAIDADNLKPVNDTHGHSTGDQLIRGVAECIRKFADHHRSTDVNARIGGDEFVVLLPETNIIQARGIAKRLEREVRKNRISANGIELALSISTGVAALRPREIGSDYRQALWILVERADVIMMATKRLKKGSS